MEGKVIGVTHYKCGKCHTVYDTISEAEQCFDRHKKGTELLRYTYRRPANGYYESGYPDDILIQFDDGCIANYCFDRELSGPAKKTGPVMEKEVKA
ncbi:MAG: hypothetical protein IKO52_10495 [Clostridia bacterium]|nr:hypothetical protein [Clostridia bacterium]